MKNLEHEDNNDFIKNTNNEKDYINLNKGNDDESIIDLQSSNKNENKNNLFFFSSIIKLNKFQNIIRFLIKTKEIISKGIDTFLLKEIPTFYIFLINFISLAFYFLSLVIFCYDITQYI